MVDGRKIKTDKTAGSPAASPKQLTPQELVSGVIRLVSLPEVCIRVNEMLEDPYVSASDIGKVIGQDTGLTARLLKIVNSAFYGFPSRIETVSRAVAVIGLRELRGLVLAASAVEAFSKIPTDIINMVNFWRHSVYCGVVAQLLAERSNVLHSERLFVAGLLHDIGKLIIGHRMPQRYREVLDLVKETGLPDYQIEKKLLGFTHAEVGGLLLKEWRMPSALCETVLCHHEPKLATESMIESSLVNIANELTLIAEAGADMELEKHEFDDYAWDMIKFEESEIEPTFEKAGSMFAEALESILPRSYYPG